MRLREPGLTQAEKCNSQTRSICFASIILSFGISFEGHHYDAGDPLGYLKANALSRNLGFLSPSLIISLAT